MTTRQISLRFFASIREAVGHGVEPYTTAATTVAELRAELIARGGAYAQTLAFERPVRAAINQQMVADDAGLPSQGQAAEVAFFPPVTGG